jgi:hypothetical protein
MGTPIRKIIYDIGGGIPNGKKVKAVQMGGPSGGVVYETTRHPVDTMLDGNRRYLVQAAWLSTTKTVAWWTSEILLASRKMYPAVNVFPAVKDSEMMILLEKITNGEGIWRIDKA